MSCKREKMERKRSQEDRGVEKFIIKFSIDLYGARASASLLFSGSHLLSAEHVMSTNFKQNTFSGNSCPIGVCVCCIFFHCVARCVGYLVVRWRPTLLTLIAQYRIIAQRLPAKIVRFNGKLNMENY